MVILEPGAGSETLNQVKLPKDDVQYLVASCDCCDLEFIPHLMSVWSYQSRPACSIACVVHMAMEIAHR